MIEGGFAYGYLFMSQHKDTPEIFKKFLSIIRPSRILEIGSFHGGLTLLLRDILDDINLKNSPIITYDINDQEFLKPLVVDRNVEVKTKNLFNYDNNSFISIDAENELGSIIQQDGLTLVLCDGGCKKCEYNAIAPLLKNKDIIMAHDYSPNLEYFEQKMKDKIWNWMEINDNDIYEVSTKYNLTPFQQELLLNIAWNCRQRITDIVN
jgi:hypothetical protein